MNELDRFCATLEARGRNPRYVAYQRYLIAEVGDMLPEALDRAIVRLRRAGMGNARIGRTIQACRQFARWCGSDALLRYAPHAQGDDRYVRRALSWAEFDRLVSCCPQQRALAYLLGMWCGLRRGEVAGLMWHMVDVEERVLRLPARLAKARRDQVVNMAPAVMVGMVRHGVRQVGQVVRPPTMRQMRHDLEVAGVEYRTQHGVVDFHALRTTCGTLLSEKLTLHELQAHLRHSSPVLTSRYYVRHEQLPLRRKLEGA